MKSGSKKALQENIKTEMDANPGPAKRAQNLAIAFSVQRKAKGKKKMAYGGEAVRKDGNPGIPARKSDDSRLPMDEILSQNAHVGGPAPKRKPDDKRLPEDEYMSGHFADGGEIPDSESTEGRGLASIRKGMNKGRDENPAPKPSPTPSYAYAQGGGVDDEESIGKKIGYPGMAKGGDVEEHYESIADAILAKKQKSKKMMAEGGSVREDESISDGIMRRRKEQYEPSQDGMVDLEQNSEEMPNQYDEVDGKAAHEEQYDDSQLSKQPMDSNEHGDSIDSDEHDMLDSIRKKIKAKRGM